MCTFLPSLASRGEITRCFEEVEREYQMDYFQLGGDFIPLASTHHTHMENDSGEVYLLDTVIKESYEVI